MTTSTPPRPQSPAVAAWTGFASALASEGWRQGGLGSALAALCAGMRAVPHLGVDGPALVEAPHADRFYAVAHRHYLALDLTMPERIAAFCLHAQVEARCGSAEFLRRVASPEGFPLWQAEVENRRYVIALRRSKAVPHEGPLTVDLRQGDAVLHTLSFSWVQRGLIDGSMNQRPVAWLTRNQSAPANMPAAREFGQDFRHQAPSYFCMAALMGVLAAHGCSDAAGIEPDRQVAYETEHHAGFQRSYRDFWATFGGTAWMPRAMHIPLPARLPPLASVAAKHRGRARLRRQHWATITDASREALAPHVLPVGAPVPLPQRTGHSHLRRVMTALALCLASALALDWAISS